MYIFQAIEHGGTARDGETWDEGWGKWEYCIIGKETKRIVKNMTSTSTSTLGVQETKYQL
jgi:hypothetical protein